MTSLTATVTLKNHKLTKRKIWNAIVKEPLLRPGTYEETHEDILADKFYRQGYTCSHCAVGAILCGYLKEQPLINTRTWDNRPYTVDDLASSLIYNGSAKELISAWEREDNPSDNFLQILSCEYEHYSEQLKPNRFKELTPEQRDEARMYALMVVEAICPAVLEFRA